MKHLVAIGFAVFISLFIIGISLLVSNSVHPGAIVLTIAFALLAFILVEILFPKN